MSAIVGWSNRNKLSSMRMASPGSTDATKTPPPGPLRVEISPWNSSTFKASRSEPRDTLTVSG